MELGLAAERAFSSDPNPSLIKLRQLGEALAQEKAERATAVPTKRARKSKADA